MKICIVTRTLFSYGGVQRVTTVLANELAKTHEVYVVTHLENSKNNIYNLDTNNINVIQTNLYQYTIFTRLFNRIVSNFYKGPFIEKILYKDKVISNLEELFKKYNFDIIIGTEGYFSLILSKLKDKIPHVKMVGWFHNSYDAYFNSPGRYYYNQVELFQDRMKRLDELVVLTENDKLNYDNILSINSKVIYNPLSFISEDKSPLYEKNFLAVGRLTKQKGFDILIECFREFNKKDKEWRLKIIGEGEDETKINSLIEKYNLKKYVELKPFTNNIQQEYMSSSVYLCTSRWEGFGLVVTEALEMGLPVISFETTGPSEIIQNYNCGYIVENFNVKQFSKKMLQVSQNSTLMNTMSLNARERARDFYMDSIIKKWMCIINEKII